MTAHDFFVITGTAAFLLVVLLGTVMLVFFGRSASVTERAAVAAMVAGHAFVLGTLAAGGGPQWLSTVRLVAGFGPLFWYMFIARKAGRAKPPTGPPVKFTSSEMLAMKRRALDAYPGDFNRQQEHLYAQIRERFPDLDQRMEPQTNTASQTQENQ